MGWIPYAADMPCNTEPPFKGDANLRIKALDMVVRGL
jgi:hypothetical protein